jgi:hypothetical protein
MIIHLNRKLVLTVLFLALSAANKELFQVNLELTRDRALERYALR